MAYDEGLAARVRDLLAREGGLVEKRMFGGLAMMLDGNMAVGVSGKGGLMVRVDPEEHEALLGEPGAHVFEMGGRSMKGWLRVDADAVVKDTDLRRWVDRGLAYARSLPPK
jgi:TfoX/Sxy family transcriptional regulator of competence genes